MSLIFFEKLLSQLCSVLWNYKLKWVLIHTDL